MKVLFIDTETTGLTPDGDVARNGAKGTDRLVSLAALLVEDGEIREGWYTLLNPERPIPAEATAINGLTDDAVKDKRTFRQVLPELVKMLRGVDYVAGHYVPFDIGFLRMEARKAGDTMLDWALMKYPLLDTRDIAKSLYSYPDNKLVTIAAARGYEFSGAHNADTDIRMTFKVFMDFAREKCPGEKFAEVCKRFASMTGAAGRK